MKKITALAALAVTAMAAQAQYNVDPSTAEVLKNDPRTVDYITLSDGAISDLQAAGATVNYVGPASELGRNLWYWNGFTPADESMPRVDMEEGGYIAVEVTGDGGWSGAGVAIDAPGVDLSHFCDETHFHIAYMTPTGVGPSSIALIILDGESKGSAPAKVALGAAFNDGGNVYPSLGATINDDWQGVDITFAELKKIYPAFAPGNLSTWEGNIFSWLGGGIAGQSMAFDALYFYTPANSGIAAVEAEAQFVVTANTINVAGANGITLYNITGQTVKSTAGTTLGITGLPKGVYLAKAGKIVRKIVIR